MIEKVTRQDTRQYTRAVEVVRWKTRDGQDWAEEEQAREWEKTLDQYRYRHLNRKLWNGLEARFMVWLPASEFKLWQERFRNALCLSPDWTVDMEPGWNIFLYEGEERGEDRYLCVSLGLLHEMAANSIGGIKDRLKAIDEFAEDSKDAL